MALSLRKMDLVSYLNTDNASFSIKPASEAKRIHFSAVIIKSQNS